MRKRKAETKLESRQQRELTDGAIHKALRMLQRLSTGFTDDELRVNTLDEHRPRR
jgi:hypothetical protein